MCAYHVLIATDLTEDGLQILKDAPGVTTEVVPPNLPAVRDGLVKADALIAREDVRVREAEVGVDDDRAVVAPAEFAREIDGQRRLADAALARSHGEDGGLLAGLRLIRLLDH